MEPKTLIWYVAYGTNLEGSGVRHHLARHQGARAEAHLEPDDSDDSRLSNWLDIPHHLYFAGNSKSWSGPVAFVSLTAADSHERARGRAFLLTVEELQKIAASENGYADLPDIDYALRIPVGAWAPLPAAFGADGFKGKYNAILRLPDAEDRRPMVTLTTSRALSMGVPPTGYLSRIRAGLADDPTHPDIDRLLSPALVRTGQNTRFITRAPSTPVEWSGVIDSVGGSTALRSITLPRRCSGATSDVSMMLGTVVHNRIRLRVWVLLADVAAAQFSLGAYKALSSALSDEPTTKSLTIELEEVRFLRSGAGDLQDLPDSDVVHVGLAEGDRLGRWALLLNEGVTGPVRVRVRSSVADGEAKVAYATRTLFTRERHDPVYLQPLQGQHHRRARFEFNPLRALGEWLFGAPAVALRAMEGLVGDEGRSVIRVDAGALDFIGAEPGDTVIVTWAHRRVKARVLLQSDLTRQRMDEQLGPGTGQQVRIDTPVAVHSRLAVPAHMRAWVSPSLRVALQVPADTVVRVRRSIGHLLIKNAARIALPLAALVVGGFALPDVNLPAWVTVSVVVLVLTLIPLRMRHTNGGRSRLARPKW